MGNLKRLSASMLNVGLKAAAGPQMEEDHASTMDYTVRTYYRGGLASYIRGKVEPERGTDMGRAEV